MNSRREVLYILATFFLCWRSWGRVKKQIVLGNNENLKNKKITFDSSDTGIIVRGDNVTLENLEFLVKDSNRKHDFVIKVEDGVKNLKIINCKFFGSRYCVVKFEEPTSKDSELKYKKLVQGVLLSGCSFEGQFVRHLFLASAKKVHIQKCLFKGSLRDSIRLRQNISDVLIEKCRFVDIGQGTHSESADAIDTFWSGRDLVVRDNLFRNIKVNGLDLKGKNTGNVIVEKNRFEKIGFSPILISSGISKHVKDFVISSNHMEEFGFASQNTNDSGIFLRHGVHSAVIKENTIKAKNKNGIVIGSFEEKRGQTRDIVVEGNIISSTAFGIYIFASKNITIRNNKIVALKKVKKIGRYKSFIGDL